MNLIHDFAEYTSGLWFSTLSIQGYYVIRSNSGIHIIPSSYILGLQVIVMFDSEI